MTIYRLVDEKSGEEIPIGSARETIQGPPFNRVTIVRFAPPSEADLLGRVWAERGGSVQSFKPAVIRAKIEVAPRKIIPFRLGTK